MLWRGVERIIPDIRQRAEVQMVCQPSNAVSCVLVLVLAHSRLKGYMLHRDQPGGVWLRSGWHAANAPALPPAAQRDVRARHQGRAGDIPWPNHPHPRCMLPVPAIHCNQSCLVAVVHEVPMGIITEQARPSLIVSGGVVG